jgi:methylthioribose-1-phosphate isomerase
MLLALSLVCSLKLPLCTTRPHSWRRETLRSEVSDCQEKLKTARQTITNLQGVNKEMEQLHSHSRALEEEKSRVTDAYTAIEEQMRSVQGMLAENEEIGVSK